MTSAASSLSARAWSTICLLRRRASIVLVAADQAPGLHRGQPIRIRTMLIAPRRSSRSPPLVLASESNRTIYYDAIVIE
jgi:hypothetical protein